MKICEDGHGAVVFQGNKCPVCLEQEIVMNYQKRVKDLIEAKKKLRASMIAAMDLLNLEKGDDQ